jgi:hypothetical protein
MVGSVPQSREGVNGSSFRVENRRARPKIIKNVNNICNIFIFQNNNNSSSLSSIKNRGSV